jgi:hypothetical protein
LFFQRAEEDTSSLYSWVSESDWSSDYEEFVEKKDRNDPQTEEKTRETTPRPTIPSKYRLHCKKGSVVDPHWFQCGSGSRSKDLMTENWEKITAEKFFYIENCNLLIPRPL